MTESPGWELREQDDVFGVMHVVPEDDLIMHEPEDCVCGPKTEPQPQEDGSMRWLVTHNSLDGREANE